MGEKGLVEGSQVGYDSKTQNVCQTIYQKHKRPFHFSGSWKGMEEEGVAFPIRGQAPTILPPAQWGFLC